jgi:hypothetical protein
MKANRNRLNAIATQTDGATGPETMPILTLISAHQDYWRVVGHVGEIGVYFGRYILGLACFLNANERAVGIDLFDDQEFNLDQAGIGSLEIFKKNIAAHAADPSVWDSIRADSTKFHNFRELQEFSAKYREFKLFSVDGCHTTSHTLADIAFGANILANGGLLIVDDFGNAGWSGVVDGTSLYFTNRNIRLAPLVVGFNKLICTTISHHNVYFKALSEWIASGASQKYFGHSKTLKMYGNDVFHFNEFKGL